MSGRYITLIITLLIAILKAHTGDKEMGKEHQRYRGVGKGPQRWCCFERLEGPAGIGRGGGVEDTEAGESTEHPGPKRFRA